MENGDSEKIWKKIGMFKVLPEKGSSAVCINDGFPIFSPFPQDMEFWDHSQPPHGIFLPSEI